MPQVNLNGITIHYESMGAGFPLVLIHGLGASLEQWRLEPLMDKLSRKNRVIAFDCRGHGLSDKPEQYSMEDHINDVIKLIDYLGIEQTNLMGHSMGSYIGQGVAIKEPHRINRLLLITPKSNGLTSSVERIMTENADILSRIDRQGQTDLINNLVLYDTGILQKYPELMNSTLSEEQKEAARGALRSFDFREDLKNVTAKTLIISGKYDGLNSSFEGQVCAEKISGAQFIEMEHSGHMPMAEEPERFLQIVDTFLSE